MSPHLPQEAEFAIKNIESFEFLTNFISVSLEDQTIIDKMGLLAEGDVKQRAYKTSCITEQADLYPKKSGMTFSKKLRQKLTSSKGSIILIIS